MTIASAFLMTLTLLAIPSFGQAKEQLKVKTSFANTGVEPSASGTIKATMRSRKSKMLIRAKNLVPARSYQFTVDGVSQASIGTNNGGKAKLRFKTGGDNEMNFDARGLSVAINDGTDDVLATVFSGAGESSDSRVDERSSLHPTEVAPGAKGQTRFRSDSGRQRFSVEVEDLPDGSYDLFIGGVARGAVTVSGGEGETEFDSGDADKLPLDFDPRGQVVDVAQNGIVFLTGDTAADIPGVSLCDPSELEVPLASTGADADGSASARLRVRDDCDRGFRVQIEDVDIGEYILLIDGIERGTITVIDDGVDVKGQLEFDSDTDDPDELPLVFDPSGSLIEVVQGETVYFSGTFEGESGPPIGCAFQETEVPLLNAGIDPAAKGDARLRVRDDCDEDFRVEIEDLPLGDYDLRIDGTVRGTITVVDIGGEHEGQIEFDTDPDDPGELPLVFDPRGALIEVEQGATVYLSRVFPTL